MQPSDSHTAPGPLDAYSDMPGPGEHRRNEGAFARAFEAARVVAERRLILMEELEHAFDAHDIDMMLEAVRRLLGRDTPPG